MRAYYNEIDRYCCDWLQNLMDAGHITPGRIDDRSIADVSPDDVRGYERCHFFAGIAGWELALSLSEYTGPVWTGSCPCQPFSAAGKGKASSDERHLWPVWFELIRAVRPPVIFGEQVEAAIGWGWLDLVHTDLEPEGYAIRSAVLPACGIGAPHIRQRLWFTAGLGDTARSTCERRAGSVLRAEAQGGSQGFLNGDLPERLADASEAGELADAECDGGRSNIAQREAQGREVDGRVSGLDNAPSPRQQPEGQGAEGEARHEARLRVSSDGCEQGELADANEPRSQGRSKRGNGTYQRASRATGLGNFWSDLIWLPCTDGKQRPTQPGIFPLAHGIPARVAKLRAAGNAIVPQVAAEFIKAAMQ